MCPFIATQLNSTSSCVAIDTLTDATQLSPAIGNATGPVAAYSQSVALPIADHCIADQREAGQSS